MGELDQRIGSPQVRPPTRGWEGARPAVLVGMPSLNCEIIRRKCLTATVTSTGRTEAGSSNNLNYEIVRASAPEQGVLWIT